MKTFIFRNNKINRTLSGNFTSLLLLLILAVFMAFPLVYVLINAFKPLNELFQYPPKFYVVKPTLDNFKDIIILMNQSTVPFTRYFFNTLLITAAGIIGHLVMASMAAFCFAKHRFPGQNIMFNSVILALMFSPQVTSVPVYIIMSRLGLVDTYLAVILPSFQYSLGLYLMKQFMETVPDAILESARIDGANEMKLLWNIVMPIVKPAWITLIILMIQQLWNLISPFTYSEELKTLPLALSQILAGGIARAGAGSAVAVIMLIIPLSAFIFSQTKVIETMSTSGIKE